MCRRYEEELTHLRSQLAQKAELLENCETDEQLRSVPIPMTFIPCFLLSSSLDPKSLNTFQDRGILLNRIPIFVTPIPIRICVDPDRDVQRKKIEKITVEKLDQNALYIYSF